MPLGIEGHKAACLTMRLFKPPDGTARFAKATAKLPARVAAARLTAPASRLVVERYDWNPITERLEAIYDDLAGKTQDRPVLRQANSRRLVRAMQANSAVSEQP